MMSTMVRRFGPLVGVLVLLVGVGIAASLSSPRVTRVPVPHPIGSDEAAGGSADPAAAPTATATGHAKSAAGFVAPGWLDTAAGVLCGLVLLGLLGFVVWYLLRDKGVRKGRLYPEEPVARTNRRDDLIAVLDAGLSDLADDGDPRRAVIACWLRLEQAAAAAGTPRHLGDAPGELVSRLLAEQQVSSGMLAQLADLYREARYGTHAIDDRMRGQAQAALRELRAELTASAPAAVHATPGGSSGPRAVRATPSPREGGPS